MKSLFDNDNIDELFRNELKDHYVQVPKSVWSKINARLQIKTNPLPAYLAVSVFVVGLLAVAWWGINSSNSAGRNNIAKNITVNVLAVSSRPGNTTLKKDIIQNTILSKGSKTINPSSVSTKKIINANSESGQENSVPVYSQVIITAPVNSVSEPNIPVISSSNIVAAPITDLQNMPSKTVSNLEWYAAKNNISFNDLVQPTVLPIPVTLKNKSIKGFYAGVNSSVNSIWILDRVALKDNNFNYQLTGGFTYGLQAGYNFSNNFGLETGLTLNAKDGQKYIYYLNNIEPENKRVALNYTEIPLLAKLKIPQISGFTAMPVILNLNFGLSYGYLRSAYTSVNGDKAGSQNQYPNNQINALAGFSYDIYTRHSYSYSIGLMAEYGINTINNDNQVTASMAAGNTPSRYANGSDFNSPHNLSIGITAAINYNFSLFSR